MARRDALNDPHDLYRAHAHIAERVGRAHGAKAPQWRDDLIQCAHLGLWAACLKWDPGKAGDSFTAFAVQRIHWAVLDGWRELDHLPDHYRRAVKAGTKPSIIVVTDDQWHDPVDPDPDPADVAATNTDARTALWHLACLPNPMRDVFARYAINGESLADIAAEYGKSAAWGYLLRREAIQQLRARLPSD